MKAFYIRRVLRIFPAFYVFIVFATLLAGIGFATIDRRDVIYAVTYTMNYHANYSENFSLRHLWSLAVEEQFYLLYPILLIAVHRLARKYFWTVIALTLTASFLLNIYFVGRKPAPPAPNNSK